MVYSELQELVARSNPKTYELRVGLIYFPLKWHQGLWMYSHVSEWVPLDKGEYEGLLNKNLTLEKRPTQWIIGSKKYRRVRRIHADLYQEVNRSAWETFLGQRRRVIYPVQESLRLGSSRYDLDRGFAPCFGDCHYHQVCNDWVWLREI